MEENEKMIQFLLDAISEDPMNMGLRLKLASAYLSRGNKDKAEKQIAIILAEDPNNQQAIQIQQQIGVPNDVSQPKSNSDPDYSTWFEKTTIGFKDVGGMEELKEEIRMNIVYPFEKPELFAKYGKSAGGGILLYGPPGCGKTYLAKATAGEIHAAFLSITIDDILDMWLGQSEKKLHELFTVARKLAPTVIFIDEIDALGADRMKIKGAGSTLVNQFLSELDGLQSNNDKIMVLGATNSPWQVDPAFRRPGRFDKILFVSPPDKLARAEIFKIHLKGKPIENIDYIELANRTSTFSGADIAFVCDQAVELVMKEVLRGNEERPVKMNDFFSLLTKINPSTKEWFATAKNFARYANESGTYSPILTYMKENKLN